MKKMICLLVFLILIISVSSVDAACYVNCSYSCSGNGVSGGVCYVGTSNGDNTCGSVTSGGWQICTSTGTSVVCKSWYNCTTGAFLDYTYGRMTTLTGGGC